MPKRNANGSVKRHSKRWRSSGPPKDPQLPQEILDRIIELSFNVDTVLGALPNQVHENFQNSFMQVNKACREKMIELISSLTWIELRSLDRKHTDLVRRLASHISSIDPFWSSVMLDSARTGRVILEFGRTTARSTRQHVNDYQVFLSPYSYSSMLRLVSEMGYALPEIDHLNTKLEWIPLGHLEEVELVMKFLNTHAIMTAKAGSDDREFFHTNAPITMDLLLEFVARLSAALLELFGEQTSASNMRARLVLLYMSRCLVLKAESVLRSPYCWTSPFLGSPRWRSNQYASKWIKITQRLHLFEMSALQALCELHEVKYKWMTYHAPYLTNDYHRFVKEPRFTFFSISDDKLALYYHKVGRVVSIYNAMNPLILDPTQDSSRLCDRLRKKTHAFTCASKLEPDNKRWENDAREAQIELLRYFPREGREELMREYSFYHYTDVDGEERTWLENDICSWDARSLQYLHRARQVEPYSRIADETKD